MSRTTLQLTEPLYEYLLNHSVKETPVLNQLRHETQFMMGAAMQVSPEQGQFMALLLKLIGAQNVLEVGTFTGYSSLVMAQALPSYGKVITCDIDHKAAEIAQQFWRQGGVSHKIESRIGPGLELLEDMLRHGLDNHFDFAFIDADKRNYPNYYEQALKLVRKGGLIAIDNVLWGGKVIVEQNNDKATEAIRLFNETIQQDERVDISMIPIGDGLTLARKR